MTTLHIRICFILSAFIINFCSPKLYADLDNQEVHAQSDEEAFLIRRIAEFWKDQDYTVVKIQIAEFLDKYPESSMKDYFHGIKGDILLQERKYQESLDAYSTITDPSIYEKTIINKLQCYYELDKYPEIIDEGTSFISNTSSEVEERIKINDTIIVDTFYNVDLK